MFKDIVTIKPCTDFKFGKYYWARDNLYTVHRSFAELFRSNGWLATHSNGNLDWGINVENEMSIRSTEDQFFEFFSLIMETYMHDLKLGSVTLTAHPPKAA